MGDFGLGFLKPPGDVAVALLVTGAALAAVFPTDLLVSVMGAFPFAAALAVGAITDDLSEDALVLRAGALVGAFAGSLDEVRLLGSFAATVLLGSFAVVNLAGSLAGVDSFAIVGLGAAFGVVGVFGNLAAPDDLSDEPFMGVFTGEALETERSEERRVGKECPV